MNTDPVVFKDVKSKVKIHRFSRGCYELYWNTEYVADFSTLKAAKKYFTKEFKKR